MTENKIPYKIYLHENEMPTHYYNVRADMKKKPAPIINPATMKPATAEDLEPVFCKELVKQELDDTTAYFEIPEDVQTFSSGESLLPGGEAENPGKDIL